MSLRLKDVRKSYVEQDGTRLPILGIPEFTLQTGEQVALVGESGGGKTTLLNVISGITTPDAGQVVIGNTDLTKLSEPARDRFRALKIGFIFQTFNLLPAFTALENVLLGMSFSGQKSDTKRAKDLLARVGLSHRLNHRPATLSVGEQQRVAVARSLVNRPALLLADEPTASIDAQHQATVLELIREACHEHNCALLLVTHSAEVAGQFQRVERLKDFNHPQ
ncbi:MAG: putative transporter ATP-binding protein [Planctomycetaceae bacterium]|nr:putative transporter ATP-binding protein [Planctomycetaceae bacterium]